MTIILLTNRTYWMKVKQFMVYHQKYQLRFIQIPNEIMHFEEINPHYIWDLLTISATNRCTFQEHIQHSQAWRDTCVYINARVRPCLTTYDTCPLKKHDTLSYHNLSHFELLYGKNVLYDCILFTMHVHM